MGCRFFTCKLGKPVNDPLFQNIVITVAQRIVCISPGINGKGDPNGLPGTTAITDLGIKDLVFNKSDRRAAEDNGGVLEAGDVLPS